MTISSKRQSLSNMLRRLFVFLILGGLIALCSCDPVNRKLLQKAPRTIQCNDDEDDNTSMCGTTETTDVSLSDHEEQTRISRKLEQRFMDDEDEAVDEVTPRKKRRGYIRIILYAFGAMKAALIHGMLHGIAALAGKALIVAKIALAVAIAAILKKHDHDKTSYEIVKHPQHTYAHTHSSSIDYDHRSDYGDEFNDHRKRRRILR